MKVTIDKLTIDFGAGTAAILDSIASFREAVMADLAQFQATLSEIDAETTRIATYIETLLDRLNKADLSAEEEEQILDNLRLASQRLKGIASDPGQVIPDGELPQA